MEKLRWGIISAGKISQDFASAFAALPSNEHVIIAVAARSAESAKEFAAKYSIPKAYGNYSDIVNDAEIDVIYVGSINPQHLPLAKLALEAGKHVLCEKPLCINVKEVEELLTVAKRTKRFLMEAIWSRFFPSYQQLRAELDKGSIGQPLQVFVTFGVPIADVDRVKLKELGGGGVLDIGIYCVQFASYVFGGEEPLKVISAGHLNNQGVDESTSTTLVYSGGRTATLVTHCKVQLPNEAYVVGTKGTLKLEAPFWCSTSLHLPNNEVQTFNLPKGNTNFGNSMGLHYQCLEVRRCIIEGLVESPVVSHAESKLIAKILESIRKQVGVVYPQDS